MTLTGPGGIGKTTVALRVAELLLQHYRDGVWYIDLSMLGDAPSLLEHLLRSLDLSFDTLASRHALLLLDNSERCRDSCRALVERLQLAAPRLALLVTSREPLQANLETLQPIAPLTFPKASTPASVDEPGLFGGAIAGQSRACPAARFQLARAGSANRAQSLSSSRRFAIGD
jgi:predicted ATPase